MKAKIIGSGYYLPEKIFENSHFEGMDFGGKKYTADDIYDVSGIKKRSVASDQEYASDLAFEAAKRCLEDADFDVNDLEGIIVATVTSDHIFPAVPYKVLNKFMDKNNFNDKKNILKNENIYADAFDLGNACTGFLSGLNHAAMSIETGRTKNYLVIASETLTKINDWAHKNCNLFGDGAAAWLLQADEKEGFLNYKHKIVVDPFAIMKGRGILGKPASDTVEHHEIESDHKIYVGDGFNSGKLEMMNGKKVFLKAVKNMYEVSSKILNETGWKIYDVDLIIPHQANGRIIDALVGKFSKLIGKNERKEFEKLIKETSYEKLLQEKERYSNQMGNHGNGHGTAIEYTYEKLQEVQYQLHDYIRNRPIKDRTLKTIVEHGNVSAVTIPLAYCLMKDQINKRKQEILSIKNEYNMLLTAFGSGFGVGAMTYQFR